MSGHWIAIGMRVLDDGSWMVVVVVVLLVLLALYVASDVPGALVPLTLTHLPVVLSSPLSTMQ